MLVLERRLDEKIVVGSDIVVTVVSIKGDKVKLGFDAPEHILIDREEIRDRKDRGRG